MLFLIGLLFLFLEIFVLPGFGVMGVIALLLLAFGFIDLLLPSAHLFQYALFIFKRVELASIASLVVFGIIYYFRKSFIKYFFYKNPFVLRESESSGVIEEISIVPGMVALTKTPLRPSGKIEILGKIYDAMSDGLYIPEGKTVKVVKVEGHRIIISEV